MNFKRCILAISFLFPFVMNGQLSIAREWNELLLEAIRNDYARPTVHARNLFHSSIAMYDLWAVFEAGEASPFFLGNTLGEYHCDFEGVRRPMDKNEAQKEAISYALFRLLNYRFKDSPGAAVTLLSFEHFFEEQGYDKNFTSQDYSNGPPAALGNYMAAELIKFGLQDGANEENKYANKSYQPVNDPLIMQFPGNPSITDPNRWQPLTLEFYIDQSGNLTSINTPDFLSPEWGQVTPFALKQEDLNVYERNGFDYWVYHDPGQPSQIKTSEVVDGIDDPYKWGFSLVSAWSSHLDPSDNVLIDISPASIGNNSSLPKTFEEYKAFYDYENGGDASKGHDLNPVTGKPYEPQIVPRGDYTRVLAEFWADGPDSETPPGHWFTILNYVSDHPLLEKRFSGKGDVLGALEWDVKAYFALGGAMHDAAVSAWGIKGNYDYIRPVSAIRYMADKGQSTDRSLSNYHPEGIPLIPGLIEVVQNEDPLAGLDKDHVGKIKLYTWKGPRYIIDPETEVAGVTWILAENWWPYQRPSFVTPPFAGYVSGHSTYSRAAAEVMTLLTGDAFFPGGMGSFVAKKNEFLVFEDGPSVDIVLQWATYQDASDQTSLSRIWGGIHPPVDDIPGRFIGMKIGKDAFNHAVSYFYEDKDEDGYYSFQDCDDLNANIQPDEKEVAKKGFDQYCAEVLSEASKVYPVPVNDYLTLHYVYDGELQLNILGVNGMLLSNQKVYFKNNEVTVALNKLSSGVYILHLLKNGVKLYTKKIIKN